jgi:calcineurin-like phosphoesterase
MTDVGMCGPQHSVIGRDIPSVLKHMTTAVFTRFGVGEGDELMCGALVDIDLEAGRALAIEPIRRPADLSEPPFA